MYGPIYEYRVGGHFHFAWRGLVCSFVSLRILAIIVDDYLSHHEPMGSGLDEKTPASPRAN